ncbi:hypothetical protein [Hydrogenophaga sp.]|uniref:3-hydroxyacyl-ACP dehydratase FabZ family protein n=1 Tax=Hydrogenophaga sp. TaxID=1904254 RepID=UPI0025BFA70D|nr:hypothetical protein [Hydrogenophaga sp.]
MPEPLERAWQVPLDHPAFAGHFPGHPVLPGVVLLDLALEAARSFQTSAADGVWLVPQAKFLQVVRPGDRLLLRLTPTATGTLNFEFRRDGEQVASGQLRAGAA